MEKFRLFIDGTSTGAVNMARDEALLRSVIDAKSSPCIRLYQWDPPALSIGYLQRIRDEVDLEMCINYGFDYVRRLTGGKAVLHDDELTYSIAIPANHEKMDGRGVIASYRSISRALVRALSLSGITCTMAPRIMSRQRRELSAVCFDTSSTYEVMFQGKKIIGSAQTRDKGVILQHGSVPIDWNLQRMFDVMGVPSDQKDLYETFFDKKATNITKAIGHRIEFEDLVPCFIRGFEDTFGVELIPSDYTRGETIETNRLIEDRYGHENWNRSR